MRRLLAAVVLCLSTAALADLTVVNEAVAGGKTRTVTLSARGSKAYFEMKEADGPTRTMLRDGEAKKMYLVDHAKKTIVVITEQDSKQMEAQQAALRAQMQAQLARMPPEQRARMEATMLSQAPTDAKLPVYSYERKKSPARKINGFSCEDYVIKRDGQPSGEGCFTPWKEAGISLDEFKATMARAMPPSTGGSPTMGAGLEQQDKAPGFPVWRSHLDAQGQVTTETTLKSLSKTALPASNFELPKGYAEKSMGDAMGMPPRPVK